MIGRVLLVTITASLGEGAAENVMLLECRGCNRVQQDLSDRFLLNNVKFNMLEEIHCWVTLF